VSRWRKAESGASPTVSVASASPFLTCSEVADRYRVSTRWVHERTRTLSIPHLKHDGSRRCLFLEAHLDDWDEGDCELEVTWFGDNGRRVVPA
jgi:hypothetical protein